MKKYTTTILINFLLFLLEKLGNMNLSIDYYHNVNGAWVFLQNKVYSNLNNPPGIGETVELFINDQNTLYSVVDVIYKSNNIVIYIQ